MKILGIETATRVGSLAIVENNELLGEEIISDNLRHAGQFEHSLDKLFKRTKTKFKDLEGVSVGLGPGSFTGIRVGLTIGKALSFAWNKPLFGVGTLDTLMHEFSFPFKRICPIILGEAHEIYGALYENSRNGFEKIIPEFNIDARMLLSVIGEAAFVFGPGLEKARPYLENVLSKEWIHAGSVYPRASHAGFLAQNPEVRLEGEKVVPFYIKHPAVLSGIRENKG